MAQLKVLAALLGISILALLAYLAAECIRVIPMDITIRRPRPRNADNCDCWCIAEVNGVQGAPTNVGMMSKEECFAISGPVEEPGVPVWENLCGCGEGWWRLN